MARRVAKRRGRSWIGLALLAFLVAALLIVGRRSVGVQTERELEGMAERRRLLLAERARLEGEIREAMSRARIAPVAEKRLGMRVATDSQHVLLPRPEGAR